MASRVLCASHLTVYRPGELLAQEEGAVWCLEGRMSRPGQPRSSDGRVLPFPCHPPDWEAYEAQKDQRRAAVLHMLYRQWGDRDKQLVATVMDACETFARMDGIMEWYQAMYQNIRTWQPDEIREINMQKEFWSSFSAYELGFVTPLDPSTSSALSLSPGPAGAAAAAAAEPAAGPEG